MKNKLMKLRGKITVIMMNMITCFLMAQNYVYAGINNSKAVTGTKKLFSDVSVALITLSATIGVVMILYNLIRMCMADDMDMKIYKKRISVIFICTIAAVLVTSVITIVLSYYK